MTFFAFFMGTTGSEREVCLLKEKLHSTLAARDQLIEAEKWIENWFRQHIAELSDAAGKEFAQQVDCEVAAAALQKPEVQQQIADTTNRRSNL